MQDKLFLTLDVTSNNPDAVELTRIRESLGMSIRDFASALGEPEARYKNYEYGRTKTIPARVLDKARSMEGLTGQIKDPRRSLIGSKMLPLAVYGRASAGAGETNVDANFEPVYVPEVLVTPNNKAFVIDGMSMAPELLPGDVAVFKTYSTPRAGYTYLLKTSGGEFRVKMLEWVNGEWTLVSLNPSFPPEPLGDAQLTGMLVGWYRSHGLRERIDSDPSGLRLEKYF